MILLHLQTATDWHIYSSVFISCNPETWHGKLKHCKRFCFYLREKITSSLHWLFAISVKASSWLIGLILRWSWTFFCPHHWTAANSSNQSYPHVGQWRMLLTRNISYIILLDLENDVNVCCILGLTYCLLFSVFSATKSAFFVNVNKKSPSIRINQFYFFKSSGSIHIIWGCLAAW